MNRKQTAQVLALLDAGIDQAGHPAVMLALDALRRSLLAAWQEDICPGAEAEPLIEALSALPALCREGCDPALPVKLTQAAFLLCAPEVNPAWDYIPQCRQQAARIRCLRGWKEPLADLLAHYDEEITREAEQLLELQLTMMTEVFAQLLTMARGQMAVRAARHRAKRLEEIAGIRETLSLKDVSDAQEDARTACEMTNEKFSEFAAEIAASAALLQVKEPTPGAAINRPRRLEEETEE